MLNTPILAVLGLATMVVDGHMLLNLPKPFPSQSQAGNGPLAADGSNFPCKSTGPATFEGGTATNMPLGSLQPLQFMGGATRTSFSFDSDFLLLTSSQTAVDPAKSLSPTTPHQPKTPSGR